MLKRYSLTNLFNLVMIIYTLIIIKKICEIIYYSSDININNNWSITEFLINYQGGFVRRGLLGEVIYQISNLLNLNPIYIITSFCILCFTLVITFFIVQFARKSYNWWILPLSFFFGCGINPDVFFRKDFFIILMFITIFYLYDKLKNFIIKLLLINFIIVLILASYESSFFFGIPFIALLLFNDKTLKIKYRVISCVPMFVFFLIFGYFKGNAETALFIQKSWIPIIPNFDEMPSPDSSISAIGWESFGSVIDTFKLNFLCYGNRADNYDNKIFDTYAFFIRPLTLFFIYYIAVNILFTFRINRTEITNPSKINLSSILIFQLFCLIPMFLFFSRDYGRVTMCWLAISYSIFILIPEKKIQMMFPQWYQNIILYLNSKIELILPPNKGFLALLILFVSIAPWFYDINTAINRNVFFTVSGFMSNLIHIIF